MKLWTAWPMGKENLEENYHSYSFDAFIAGVRLSIEKPVANCTRIQWEINGIMEAIWNGQSIENIIVWVTTCVNCNWLTTKAFPNKWNKAKHPFLFSPCKSGRLFWIEALMQHKSTIWNRYGRPKAINNTMTNSWNWEENEWRGDNQIQLIYR